MILLYIIYNSKYDYLNSIIKKWRFIELRLLSQDHIADRLSGIIHLSESRAHNKKIHTQ